MPKSLDRRIRSREHVAPAPPQLWKKLYSTARWREIRAYQLRTEPLCRFCLEQGKIVAAKICDHVEPHRGDPAKFWGGPFQSLCKSCHDSTKQQIEVRGFSATVGADGFPIDSNHPANQHHRAPVLSIEAAQRRMPSDLQRSAIPLTIVCGPPGAGKNTYIAQHIGPNDILIDLDAIHQRVAGVTGRVEGTKHLSQALDERNRMLRSLAHDTTHDKAWFIVSAPDARERATWGHRLGGEVITIATPLNVCIDRINADATRAGHEARLIRAAKAWWFESETSTRSLS